jgi:hypothetical protein
MVVPQSKINQFDYSLAINRRVWDNQYTFENFCQNGVATALGGGASSGVTGATNLLQFTYSDFEYNIKGTQTITAPVTALVSETIPALNPEMDLTAGDGVEICGGILSGSPNAYKVAAQNGKPFFFRARVGMSTPEHAIECAFGFRKQEAYQANIDDYADMAVLNVISGNIFIETIKGGAATVTTDTTDDFVPGSVVDFEVAVDEAGAVTYTINGNPVTVTAAYSFTAALFVCPFFFLLHDATNTDVIEFDGDFVALNSIVATVNAVPMTPVVFNTDQATTIAAVAAMIASNPVVASATVTDTREITVVFNTGGANVVNSVVTTLGVSQPTATITASVDAATGIRILEWECGLAG